MNALLTQFIDNIKNGNYLAASIIFATLLLILTLFRLKIILDFFELRQRSKISRMVAALESNYVKGATKSFLEEEIESEYFRLITSIRAERQFREAMLDIHKNANGELSFADFRRAKTFMRFKHPKIEVVISYVDKITFYLFTFFSTICLVLGALTIVLLFSQFEKFDWVTAIKLFSSGLFMICVFVFITITASTPLYAAERIKKYI
jgi:hypothetical protein